MRKIMAILISIFMFFTAINLCFNDLDLNTDIEETGRSQLIGTFTEPDSSSSYPSSVTGARGQIEDNKLNLLTDGVGITANNKFGYTLAGAGDLNSDGFDDIVIGAPNANPSGYNNAGEAYIFFGAEDFAINDLDAVKADIKISGTTAGALFGGSICIPGDINGDSKNDIVIGAPGESNAQGKIYIYYSSTLTPGSNISADTADLVLQVGSTGDEFGSVITALGDVNSDQATDIMVGAPGGDKAYIMYGPTFGSSERTVLTGPQDSDFGTAVSGGTDLNKDGRLDYVVGAPVGTTSSDNNGQVFIFFGYKNFHIQTSISTANNSLVSDLKDNLFGQSLTSQIDINDDGYYDIIISAPGDDAVYIYYGNNLIERFTYPYLWNMPGDRTHPVDFSTGVYNDVGSNTDVNTYGRGSGNDGWDWSGNVFGTSSGEDMDHIYGAREDTNSPFADAEGVDYGDKQRLEVVVGRSNTAPGPSTYWWQTVTDSGAWGIEFQISPEMFDMISQGAEAYLELDWEAHDTHKVFGPSNQGTEEPCYVKLRLTGPTTSTFLGTDLGGDSTADLFFSDSGLNTPFPSGNGHFNAEISDLIDASDSFYLEMGARLESPRGEQKDAEEGIVAFFDNVSMYVETLPIEHSVKIKGVSQSQFGGSLKVLDDVNGDGYDEIAIGAPYSNLGGTNTGAVYIIYGGAGLHAQMNSNEAQVIITGITENENFGVDFADAGNLNGDSYTELIVGAPGHSNLLGKAYVFSGCQKPEITMINPTGGMLVEGELELLANVTDHENELDRFGVIFYYSKITKDNTPNWHLISQVKSPDDEYGSSPDITYRYLTTWNTTEVPDASYHIKGVVKDNFYLSSEAISDSFEINNPDTPIVKIISPSIENQTHSGIMTIKANCTDADGDLKFATFYYSSDNIVWNYIGVDYTVENGAYQLDWDTEDIKDGNYVILVRANDTRNLSSFAVSVNFNINNPGPPSINFIQPTINDILKGYSMLKVSVNDKDNNIASSGVTISYSRDRSEWIVIEPVSVNPDSSYSTFWDTLKINDGYYHLKAHVIDTTNLSAEVILGPIKVDNPTPPSITLEPLNSPVAGKVKLRAACFDEDSSLSSEGVTFYISSDNKSWVELGRTLLYQGILTGQNVIFELEWNTLNNETPDGTNYHIRASVKDFTGLQNESGFGPFEVNNPDPPTITLDYPKDGDKLSGTVMVGAYAEDPDNDIDGRGVSFYFSTDGIKWYLIESTKKPISNSTLYQLEWDITELPNGKYHLKAEVVDKTALRAESMVQIKIDIPSEESSVLQVSSTAYNSSIFLIIIIIVLIILLLLILVKRRTRHKKQESEKDREDLVKNLRDELIREAKRYPMMGRTRDSDLLEITGQGQVPVALASASPPTRPALPPHIPTEAEKGTEAGPRPYIQDQPGSGVQGHLPTAEKQPYKPDQSKPKFGLTPDDMTKSLKAQAQANVQAPAQTQAQQQPPIQSQSQSTATRAPMPTQVGAKSPTMGPGPKPGHAQVQVQPNTLQQPKPIPKKEGD